MLTTFTARQSRNDQPLRRSRSTWQAPSAVTVLTCLLVTSFPGLPAMAAESEAKSAVTHPPVETGFTRESMAELGRPEPTPVPTEPIVSPRIARNQVKSRRVRTQVDSKDFVPNSRPVVALRPVVKSSRVAGRARPARKKNPVVRFVYWWNGFVIKTFHTKLGTVMLKTVGAES